MFVLCCDARSLLAPIGVAHVMMSCMTRPRRRGGAQLDYIPSSIRDRKILWANMRARVRERGGAERAPAPAAAAGAMAVDSFLREALACARVDVAGAIAAAMAADGFSELRDVLLMHEVNLVRAGGRAGGILVSSRGHRSPAPPCSLGAGGLYLQPAQPAYRLGSNSGV